MNKRAKMNDIVEDINMTVHNEYLYILLIFLIFDIVTGTLKSFTTNTVYSKINKQGLTQHIALFLFATFFTWVFSIFKVDEYSKVLLMFYIVSYGLSIIENVGQMGLPIPKWLTNKFKLLQEDEDNETKRTE